jgi:hypothetical protein
LRLGGWSCKTSLGKLWDPISKLTRAKWTGGVAQVVELCKYESLSSNSSSRKKAHKRLLDVFSHSPILDDSKITFQKFFSLSVCVCVCVCVFVCMGLGFEYRALNLLEPPLRSILFWLFWKMGSQAISLVWPQTVIFLISVGLQTDLSPSLLANNI